MAKRCGSVGRSDSLSGSQATIVPRLCARDRLFFPLLLSQPVNTPYQRCGTCEKNGSRRRPMGANDSSFGHNAFAEALNNQTHRSSCALRWNLSGLKQQAGQAKILGDACVYLSFHSKFYEAIHAVADVPTAIWLLIEGNHCSRD